MLIYLPDRIYELVKNDQTYNDLVTTAEQEIFLSEQDWFKIAEKYNDSNLTCLKNITDYLYTIVEKDYLQQLGFSIDDNILSSTQTTMDDDETELFRIYQIEDGPIMYSPDREEQFLKYISIYENSRTKDSFSFTLHYVYYMYKLWIKMYENKDSMCDYSTFSEFEQKLFDSIFNEIKNENNKHILLHKRIYMYTLFYIIMEQHTPDMINAKNLLSLIHNSEYKYGKYNFNSALLYTVMFVNAVDNGLLNDAGEYLVEIEDIIKYSITNKTEFTKGITQYSKSYIEQYLELLQFWIDIIYKLMPNLKNKIEPTINNLTKLEREVLFRLNTVNYKKYRHMITSELPISTSWGTPHKEILTELDKVFA